MKCSKVRTMLVALQDGELSRSQTEQILDHLEACEACAHELERLDATVPVAPVVHLSPAFRHDLHLSIEQALDRAERLPDPAEPSRGWRSALGAEIPVPRSLVILYAAALLLAIGWAARGSLLPDRSADLASAGESDAIEAPVEVTLHRPAAYTPSEGWF